MIAPNRKLVAAAAVFAFLGVALGAFGAHGLKLTGEAKEWWATGSHYHLIHSVAALVAALLGANRSGWLFLVGSIFFGGSLYVMALTNIRVLGAITPIGGVCFLAGWGLLAYGASKSPAPTA